MGYIDRNKVINYTAKGVISDSSARIVLGGTSTSIFTKDKFRGSLDEFVIYNRSLSQEEVLNL